MNESALDAELTPSAELPLLPIRGVLFPGGSIELRLIEPRHLDLLRDCSRRDIGFGVCLMLADHSDTPVTRPAAFGTRARIVDFDRGADGMLELSVRGDRRFHVQRTRVRDNGLIIGDVTWCLLDHADEALRPEHGLLASLLGQLLQADAKSVSASQLEDPVWVGFRLAERLPLEPTERQLLLQMDDPHQRLQCLLEWMPRFAGD